jgi:hypothetical protein
MFSYLRLSLFLEEYRATVNQIMGDTLPVILVVRRQMPGRDHRVKACNIEKIAFF